MESWIRHIFLNIIASLLCLSGIANAQELNDSRELDSVIQPKIKRSDFIESNIKTADFEIITNIGVISIEDFGSNPVLDLSINYHVSEDFFVGAILTKAKGDKTSLEIVLGGAPLLTDAQREMTTYLVTLGYNIFPGEAFITDNLTYNTAFYLIAGLGSTKFGGGDHFTVSIGAGYRVLVSNYFSIYTDFRNNIFNAEVFKENTTHNLKFTIGLGYYF